MITKETIQKELMLSAKKTLKNDGVHIEIVFEEQAKAIIKLLEDNYNVDYFDEYKKILENAIYVNCGKYYIGSGALEEVLKLHKKEMNPYVKSQNECTCENKTYLYGGTTKCFECGKVENLN